MPVALVAGAWTAFRPVFPARWRASTVIALVPVLVYVALRTIAETFALNQRGDFDDRTIVGFMTSIHAFGEHVGKVALGVAVPVALVAAVWWRTRVPVPWLPLLVAGAIVAQPLLLGPGTFYPGNEPRLASLAVPALAVAAGLLLVRARLGPAETLLLVGAIALAGFHPRYTRAPWDSATWAVLEVVAVVTILAVGRTVGRVR